VLGFKTGRAFLEWLATSGCRIVERGKDRLVLVEEAESALLRATISGGSPLAGDEEPLTTAAVLASIGRRAAGTR
jgi:hypothetical protein